MRPKYLVLCAFMVGSIALMATPAAGQDLLPWSCEAIPGEFSFSVVGGPTQVDCDNPTDNSGLLFNAAGGCTAVAYDVAFANNNKPDHVGILARPPVYAAPGGDFSFQLCFGDPTVTGLGMNNCHEQAIKYNPSTSKSGSFLVVVEGNRTISTTTVAVRKGSDYGVCEIVGVGPEPVIPGDCVPSCGNFDPNQTVLKEEVYDIKGCKAKFAFDLNSGSVDSFGLYGDSNPSNCSAFVAPVGDVSVFISGQGNLGNGKFGDGFFTIGGETCSCRVIGGRIYCWGAPCPDYP